MDTLWCKNFLDAYYRTAHWIYILGPFDSLPPHLIQARSRRIHLMTVNISNSTKSIMVPALVPVVQQS